MAPDVLSKALPVCLRDTTLLQALCHGAPEVSALLESDVETFRGISQNPVMSVETKRNKTQHNTHTDLK